MEAKKMGKSEISERVQKGSEKFRKCSESVEKVLRKYPESVQKVYRKCSESVKVFRKC